MNLLFCIKDNHTVIYLEVWVGDWIRTKIILFAVIPLTDQVTNLTYIGVVSIYRTGSGVLPRTRSTSWVQVVKSRGMKKVVYHEGMVIPRGKGSIRVRGTSVMRLLWLEDLGKVKES